ncbi:MAG: TerB family tellurite resistance protein [Bacteroidales bacterium]|nr:TerB family tellurite resistance protein [Bacteroidales bacterium]
MGFITKIFLTSLGWSVGGPIGALLGYLLGNVISKATDGNQSSSFFNTGDGTPHRGPYRNTGTQADINVALMVLIAAVMKSDGTVKKSELDYVKRFLLQNYGEEQGKQMLKVLQQLVQQDIPIVDVCAQIKVNTDYNTRYHMVDFLFGIGGADGEFQQAELNMLRLISQYLGISQSDYTSIHERHVGYRDTGYGDSSSRSGGSGRSSYNKDPYKVLGISSNATDDDVRKAYRKMAMKYHPDRVAGMGEEMQRNAAEQMKEINQAYDEIKRRRPNLK